MRSELRGLSVVEILIAMMVLTVAALGLIAAMTRLMMAQSSSSHQTVARLLADSVLQQAVLVGPPNFGPGPLDQVLTKSVRVGQNADLVDFSYQRFAQEMLPSAAFYPSGMSPPPAEMGKMWEVKVRVWWTGGDAYEGAVEKGTRTVEVSRIVYIET